jgi:hypothetical protein
MRVALHDLNLGHLWILYPETEAYALDERLSVLPLRDVVRLPERIVTGSESAGTPLPANTSKDPDRP